MGRKIMSQDVAKDAEKNNVQTFDIVCRGCTIGDRELTWNAICTEESIKDDNSYLTFEEEPTNRHDLNAVKVVVRGEFFGTIGYVGREYAVDVKNILKQCSEYRVDIIDLNEAGQREIRLRVSWIAKTAV